VALAFFVVMDVALLWFWLARPDSTRFDQEIREAAARYQLDAALVKAVVWRESKFDPDARGKAGEIGLMQVMEEASLEWVEAEKIDRFEHEDLFDPKKNLLAGTYYLSKVMKRYLKTDNPVIFALADYNAGRGNVLRWSKGAATTNSAAFLATMDYPGTRQYALAIAERHAHYREKFGR
jgi:soluble lytic murein transglycosylase